MRVYNAVVTSNMEDTRVQEIPVPFLSQNGMRHDNEATRFASRQDALAMSKYSNEDESR